MNTLPWGSTGRSQRLSAGSSMKEQKAHEKAETNDERQEDFLCQASLQPFTLGAQQCAVQNVQ